MKLRFLYPWCLVPITSLVEAGSVRKRLRRSLELYDATDRDRHPSGYHRSLFEEQELFIVRELEMSMSMPTSEPSPVTNPPTRDGVSTSSPTPVSVTLAPVTAAPSTSGATAAPTIDERDTEVLEKCGQTSLERSRDILSILTSVSEETSLLIVGTPQFNARLWLDETDPAIICADQPERVAQRYRAALLYYALEGSGWTTTTGWLEESYECEWFGIACNGFDASSPDTFFPITAINLSENNLLGNLPVETFGLISLEKLGMQKNKVSGNIPSEIGNLMKLQELDLDENQLSGSLPLTLYNLEEINKIDLNGNQLSGQLSDDIGNLSKLLILQLEANQFSGPVPSTGLLKLENLVALTIHENEFSGSLEPLCDVIDDRRVDNEEYLSFLFADSCGDPPPVECSCCTCLA